MSAVIQQNMGLLKDFVQRGPRALFATISGAHLYGFESPDSDFDLRGVFVTPLVDVLKMGRHEQTLSIMEDQAGLEMDWVAHDILKFATLMTRRNGYVLEQLYSPLVVHGGPWLDELRELGRGCIIRHLYHHYRGFAHNQQALLQGGDHTVKRLLYTYRVLLTGIHVLRTGKVEANLSNLLQEFPTQFVEELIQRKRAGIEKGRLAVGEAEAHAPALGRLFESLENAHEHSKLPKQVQSMDQLSDFVVRSRLELGRE